MRERETDWGPKNKYIITHPQHHQKQQHGINFMPFTPITEAYLDPEYVKEEYPVLATVLDRPDDPVEEEWLGFVHLDHAILDPVRRGWLMIVMGLGGSD